MNKNSKIIVVLLSFVLMLCMVSAAAAQETTITMSWWGGDARHEATQKAVEKFMELNPDIKVEVDFGAWTDWETKMSTAFSAGAAADLDQVNWNWIQNWSPNGEIFADLNQFADIIDLSQFADGAKAQCTYGGELQAIPVSMTGRIFYWNKSTFDKAGIETPKTLADLYAAGETFKTVLGDDYYPIALGEYDRMILMVYYLESVYGKDWVVDGTLNYTAEEIGKGLEFIQSLEDGHVTPSVATILGDGAKSLDVNPKWLSGNYAGIFEWDSSASKFGKGLTEAGMEFIVGDYMPDMGEYQGGYTKVSLGFAIAESAENKEAAAKLINFMLNEKEGAEILGSQRGIPLSKAGLQYCLDADLLDPMVAEANIKVLAWCSNALDPTFESADLKNDPDGVYYDVMSGLSYGDYDIAEATDVLIEGINAVLAK